MASAIVISCLSSTSTTKMEETKEPLLLHLCLAKVE